MSGHASAGGSGGGSGGSGGGSAHHSSSGGHHSGSSSGSGSGTLPAAAVPVATPPRPFAYAFSADTAKVVHLVRHGQGYHNVEAALLGAAAYKKTSLTDARLDETGKAQAMTLGMRIREARMVVDIVLVSPLTRTLETASLMFPDKPDRASTGGGASGSGTATTSRTTPFYAVELCREAHGGHPCDQRRPISVVRKEFPHVDFSGVGTDEDTWHNPDRRETVREVAIRCDKFLTLLRARPERNIVVVSHGVFLETLLNRCGLFCTDDSLRLKRFENAEMRSCVFGGWVP